MKVFFMKIFSPANLISIECSICEAAGLSALPQQLFEFGWRALLRLHSCPIQTCPQSEHQIILGRSNPSGIYCLPSEAFPQGKCCSFAIVYEHQPIAHTWPEFEGLL